MKLSGEMMQKQMDRSLQKPELFSVQQVAMRLNVSSKTIRRLTGALAAIWHLCADGMSWIIAAADHHAGLAAWVEALGVLAAFIGSIALAYHAERRAERVETKRAEKAQYDLVMRAGTLVFHIDNFLEGLPPWVRRGAVGEIGSNDWIPEESQVIANLLEAFPIAELPDSSMTAALASLQAKLNRIASLLTDPAVPENAPRRAFYIQSDREAAGAIVPEAREDCADCRRLVQEYRDRGGPWEPPDEDDED